MVSLSLSITLASDMSMTINSPVLLLIRIWTSLLLIPPTVIDDDDDDYDDYDDDDDDDNNNLV